MTAGEGRPEQELGSRGAAGMRPPPRGQVVAEWYKLGGYPASSPLNPGPRTYPAPAPELALEEVSPLVALRREAQLEAGLVLAADLREEEPSGPGAPSASQPPSSPPPPPPPRPEPRPEPAGGPAPMEGVEAGTGEGAAAGEAPPTPSTQELKAELAAKRAALQTEHAGLEDRLSQLEAKRAMLLVQLTRSAKSTPKVARPAADFEEGELPTPAPVRPAADFKTPHALDRPGSLRGLPSSPLAGPGSMSAHKMTPAGGRQGGGLPPHLAMVAQSPGMHGSSPHWGGPSPHQGAKPGGKVLPPHLRGQQQGAGGSPHPSQGGGYGRSPWGQGRR